MPKTETPEKTEVADVISIGLSGLCVIHCLLIPVLAASMPLVGDLFGWEGLHKVLVMTAVPASGWALWRKKRFFDLEVMLPIALGLGMLAVGAFVPISLAVERIFSIAGAVLIAFGHWRNLTKPKPVTDPCGEDPCVCA